MNKTETKKRFRFSIRTMLIVFALVAVLAGLLSGTLGGYFREMRIANALEADGADALRALVPPKGTVNRLLYRFGARKIFYRVLNIEYSKEDRITDASATAIGRLPHLTRLKIEGTPISDQQLESIAQSPSLQFLELSREGKLIALQRTTSENLSVQRTQESIDMLSIELEQAQSTVGYDANVIEEMEAQLSGLKDSLANQSEESTPEPLRNDFGDDGIRAFANHPTLQTIVVLGCKVSDDALREVFESLDTKENIDDVIQNRRRDELTLCGAQVVGVSNDGTTNFADVQDSDFLSIRIRDSQVDFARLQYVLPKGKDWELRLPRHLPLDNPNRNGFSLKSFLEEIEPHQQRIRTVVANRDALALWEIVHACKSARRVVLGFEGRSPNLMLHAKAAAQVPHVEDLTFEKSYFTDDDLTPITKMTFLKRLSIPNALITTVGLQRLIDSDLELEHIRLPKSFTAFAPMIQDSGLAKEVACDGNPDLFYGTIPNPKQFGERFGTLIRHAKFPWPEDSPRRPEDQMLYLQRQAILGLELVSRTDHGIDELNESLKKTPQVEVAIEDLIATAPNLRAKYAKQHQSDSMGYLKDWQQIVEIYGELAGAYRSASEYEKALEMQVRQAAWAPMTPYLTKRLMTDQDLGELCQRTPDSPRTKLMKQYFFLVARANPTEFEAPMPHNADWYPGKPHGVPVLAPFGRQLVQISSKKNLKVRTATLPDLEVTSDEADSDRKYVELPAETQIAYVDRSSFPIQVFVEPLGVARAAKPSDNPFALGPPTDGSSEEVDVPGGDDLDPTPQRDGVEFDVPELQPAKNE